MKAFFRPAFFFGLALPLAASAAEELPRISGAWAELRQAPVFEASVQKLAPPWGPVLPVGNAFRVEKVYGRWLYGTPEPLARMKKAQEAAPGWVFSRTLLKPGDEDTLSPELVRRARAVLFHARAARPKLNLGASAPASSPLDFYEGLTLSKGTVAAFRRGDEAPLTWWQLGLPPLLPTLFEAFSEARAEEKKAPEAAPGLGLTGADLEFLDQEFAVKATQRRAAEKSASARRLKAPPPPALDDKVRTAVLGRFMLEKYLELPPLTHEEVDGYIYMRATAWRALEGCPASIRDYWKGRRFHHFRVYRLKSRPEVPHPWLEVSLPGGYFAVSARAIELAGNEAELAYLLVRPLVREPRLQRQKPKFSAKGWPAGLPALSEEFWDQELRAQSTKESDNLDVADEIAVDYTAAECLARAGYRPGAGLSYLRKLSAKQEEPWAAWFRENALGLDYRLERVGTLVDDASNQHRFPEATATNPKRFSTAARYWNLLP